MQMQKFGSKTTRALLAIISAMFFTCDTFAQADTETPQTPFTHELANKIAVYAMMASNAYVDESAKTAFPLASLGWKKIDVQGVPVTEGKNSYTPKTPIGKLFSNLQFDIWERAGATPAEPVETVFAFKGSEEKIDWGIGNLAIGLSVPYKSAKKQVREYVQKHPERKNYITLVGHSLGGGIALSVSVWDGYPAYVFNTSPRIWDGRENANMPATRLAVFQQGDILQKIRSWYPKFQEKIKPNEIVATKFDYGIRGSHRSDLIAEGILACATDPALMAIAATVKPTVNCPL